MPEIITLSATRGFLETLEKFCGKNRSEFVREAIAEKIERIKQEQ